MGGLIDELQHPVKQANVVGGRGTRYESTASLKFKKVSKKRTKKRPFEGTREKKYS